MTAKKTVLEFYLNRLEKALKQNEQRNLQIKQLRKEGKALQKVLKK